MDNNLFRPKFKERGPMLLVRPLKLLAFALPSPLLRVGTRDVDVVVDWNRDRSVDGRTPFSARATRRTAEVAARSMAWFGLV